MTTSSLTTSWSNSAWTARPIILYALLTTAACVAVWLAGWTSTSFALSCAIVAFGAERCSLRARQPLAPNAAPACYMLAALLLPAPWAVLIAATAVITSYLSVRKTPPCARLAATAHTTLVVAAFTLVAHLVTGDADALRRFAALVRSRPLATIELGAGLPAPPLHGLGTDLQTLLALIASYYLLDTLPRMFVAAAVRGASPLRAWGSLYAHVTLPSLGVLAVGVLGAVVARTSPALLALAGLVLVVPHQAFYDAWARRNAEAELQARRAETARLREEADTARATGAQARLEAVLASVQVLARRGSLAEVTQALTQVATHLTPFRSCTVALYDPQEDIFVAQGSLNETAPGNAAPRDVVAAWMDERNLVGYSYWVRPARATGAHQAWYPTDHLLIPLPLKQGDVIGYLALSHPSAGYIPTAADLAPIEAVAALAASVVDRLRQAEMALQLAATDGLTGLLNRRTIEERLRDRLTRAQRRFRPLALLMIDLDDFGGINNTHGHQVGDAALRLVAGVIRAQLRAGDLGGRYGGDEFVLVLPELDATRARDVAERLRVALVAATTEAAAEGTLPLIHTSIGVAACPDHGSDPATLMKAADDALYQSKRLGKNCVSLAPAA